MINPKKPCLLYSLFFIYIFCFGNTKIKAMDFIQGGVTYIYIMPNEANAALLKAEKLGYSNLAVRALKTYTDSSTTRYSTINETVNFNLNDKEDIYQAFAAVAFTGNIDNLNKLITYLTLTTICIKDRKTIEDEEDIGNISNAINNSLKSAALAGETNIIECLLTKKITINRLSTKGLKEALGFAASNNHVEVVQQFIWFLTNPNLSKKIFPNKKENITDCALLAACAKNNINVIAALINNKIILKSFTEQAIEQALQLTENRFQEAFQSLISKKRIKNIYLKKQKYRSFN